MSERDNTWVRVSCRVADILRHEPRVQPISSKTDLSGEYGQAEVYTLWAWDGDEDKPVMEEHRWPDPSDIDHPALASIAPLPDLRPCEHYVPGRTIR